MKLYAWRLTRSTDVPDWPRYSPACESFAASLPGAVALVLTKNAGHMASFYVSASPQEAPVRALCDALGATAVACEPPLLAGGASVCARVAGNGLAGRTSLAGMEAAGAAGRVDNVLGEGETVTIVLRKMPAWRRGAWARFTDNLPGEGQHHTVRSNVPLLASVVTSSASRRRSGQLVSHVCDPIPGWDTRVRGAREVTTALGVLLVLAGVAGLVLAGHLEASEALVRVARCVSLTVLLAGLVRALVPSRSRRLVRALVRGRIPSPSPLPSVMDALGRSWPVGRLSVPTTAPVVAGLAAPQEGATTTARARAVPAELAASRGPLIGTCDGQVVALDANHLWGGVGIVGAPGTGKSVLLRDVFTWMLIDRERHPASAIIAVESKPDGVSVYERMAGAAGHSADVLTVECANPSSAQIDMFTRAGDTIFERAELVVASLADAFDDGAIMGRSREALTAVIAGGMAFDDAAWDLYESTRATTGGAQIPWRSWFGAAWGLVGRAGEATGVALHRVLAERAQVDATARAAFEGLDMIYGPSMSATARRTYTEAARNKIDSLRQVAHALAPVGACYTWEQVLEHHGVVVVGTGPSRDGRFAPPSDTCATLTALIGLTLRSAVERTCFGWQAAGRSVSVIVDEFKFFAGTAPRVATWWKDDGRSWGVRPIMATQYVEQLAPEVKASFLSYQTFASFRQDSVEAARAVAAQVARDGSAWSEADITTLADRTVVVSTFASGRTLPAFTCTSLFGEGDPVGLVAKVRGLA